MYVSTYARLFKILAYFDNNHKSQSSGWSIIFANNNYFYGYLYQSRSRRANVSKVPILHIIFKFLNMCDEIFM